MTQSTSEQRRPFLSAPCPERYFAAGAIEEARQRIVRAIARNEGPAMLIGGAGTGKSLLLAVLADQFASRVAVVALEGAQLVTRRALLQAILCELGQPYRGMDEGELRLELTHYLRGIEAATAGTATSGSKAEAKPRPRRIVLLVDEADALPIRLLEELRVLTNAAAGGLPLVSLVLAGGPILEERFADPHLDGFAQRVAARCYLAPLGREETLQYVRSQVAAAGVQPERLFTAEALEAIYSATGGVPRLINQLGDQLAWIAEETGCTPLDAALVQQAWSDVQQLPAPWNTEGHAAAAAPLNRDAVGVIEFGELDAAGDFHAHALEGDELDDVLLEDDEEGSAEEAEGGIAEDGDDDCPASIPIHAARIPRLPFEDKTPDETLAETEHLLFEYDDLVLNKEVGDAGEPQPEEPGPPAAENPFDEPFEEEEIVIDPYRAFEADMLRSAPQVVNRLDRAFAMDLGQCTQVAPAAPKVVRDELADEADALKVQQLQAAESLDAEPEARLTQVDDAAPVKNPGVRLHEESAPRAASLESAVPDMPRDQSPAGGLLIVEEDEDPAPRLIQGRQFRRLFTALESNANSRLG